MNIRQIIADEEHRLTQESDGRMLIRAMGHEAHGMTQEEFTAWLDKDRERIARGFDALKTLKAQMKAEGYI